jgi:hypothetical protein
VGSFAGSFLTGESVLRHVSWLQFKKWKSVDVVFGLLCVYDRHILRAHVYGPARVLFAHLEIALG